MSAKKKAVKREPYVSEVRWACIFLASANRHAFFYQTQATRKQAQVWARELGWSGKDVVFIRVRIAEITK